MPTPNEIVNSFLEDKVADALDFMINKKASAETIYDGIKLNRQRIEEETQKKQKDNFM